MLQQVLNSNYSIILSNIHAELNYIINEAVVEMQEGKEINWYNFNINDFYFTDNGQRLTVTNIDHISKMVIIELI